jgi:hypothetical protein
VIPAAKAPGCRRICFFGESVAAGYLYAPHLTPARALEAQLDACSADGGYEVVDLARTNERLPTLVRTLESSLQLAPDLLVLFMGNNWTLLETPEASPHFPSVRGRLALAAALRDDGLRGASSLGAKRMLQRAGSALASVAEISLRGGVPVIVVVPEVNLADWETAQPAPWLPGRLAARWHARFERARRLLDAEDWRALESEAREMLDLDSQTGPTPHRLLARALAGQGDLEAAAAACREEVAAVHYATLGPLAAPQAAPMAQELLRRAAHRHGFGCVDLPAVFAAHLGSPLPGKELFLDYCHLTRRGIRLAGGAIAAATLNLFDDTELGWRDILARAPLPDLPPEAEASTYLGAAIHTAHRLHAVGGKLELLKHWCRRALGATPAAELALLDFARARTARTPAVLTAALARVQSSPFRMTLQHGWRWDHLDPELLQAIVEVLKEDGSSSGEEIVELLAGRNHATSSRADGALDLALAPHLWEPVAQSFPDAMTPATHAFFRSLWPSCDFVLPATGTSDLVLEAVTRSQQATAPDASLGMRLNGEPVGRLPLTRSWQRAALDLPSTALRRGLNRLTLEWPSPAGTGEEAIERAIDRLELGLDADLHPIFGEVYSLTVRG